MKGKMNERTFMPTEIIHTCNRCGTIINENSEEIPRKENSMKTFFYEFFSILKWLFLTPIIIGIIVGDLVFLVGFPLFLGQLVFGGVCGDMCPNQHWDVFLWSVVSVLLTATFGAINECVKRYIRTIGKLYRPKG